ncbi:hypothetical protein BZA70DRAFT_312518 [Myxozyma melibiosi]|uniref:U1 small nuclear ribonucleoprotein component SNU71 n=1 Tax=Myxozyma melibiosi TaxID=54550 RepID=A0ABR1F0S3_9ASCO
MLFDESNAAEFRAWLVRKLENMSDADSEILSDYVIALLRHGQPENEIRQMCLDQLQDFLQDNTVPFVNDVFAALKTKEYLSGGANSDMMDATPAADTTTSDQPSFRPDAPSFVPSQPAGGYQTWNNNVPIQQENQNQQQQFPQQNRRRGRCRAYDEKGYCMKGDLCPYEHGSERIIVEKLGGPNAAMAPGGNMPAGFQPMNNRFQRGGMRGGMRGGRFQRAERPAHFNYVQGSSQDPTNRKLVVEKIPPEYFNMESIRPVFEAFGPVEDIEINDAVKLAVITYADHDSAQQAWSSPVPVFQNRFVKVYWQSTDDETRRRGRDGDRSRGDRTSNYRKRSASPPAPPINVEEIKQRQAEKQREYEERMSKKREHEEKLAMIKRQSEELIKKQEQEREALLQKIRAASEEKSGSAGSAAGAGGNDGDMEVQTQESSTTEMLKAKLEQLKREAELLGVDPSKASDTQDWYSAGRGRGGFRGRGAPRGRGRGRGGFFMAKERATLDLRPKIVSVTGLDDADVDKLVTTLVTTFGEDYETSSRNLDTGAYMVSFNTRQAAERFFYADPSTNGLGPDAKFAWYNPTPPVVPTIVAPAASAAKDEDMLDDDDEEWRRGIAREENGNGVAMHEDEDGDVY